jgi:hypothetical protein
MTRRTEWLQAYCAAVIGLAEKAARDGNSSAAFAADCRDIADTALSEADKRFPPTTDADEQIGLAQEFMDELAESQDKPAPWDGGGNSFVAGVEAQLPALPEPDENGNYYVDGSKIFKIGSDGDWACTSLVHPSRFYRHFPTAQAALEALHAAGMLKEKTHGS